jgi:hypothetical protein
MDPHNNHITSFSLAWYEQAISFLSDIFSTATVSFPCQTLIGISIGWSRENYFYSHHGDKLGDKNHLYTRLIYYTHDMDTDQQEWTNKVHLCLKSAETVKKQWKINKWKCKLFCVKWNLITCNFILSIPGV